MAESKSADERSIGSSASTDEKDNERLRQLGYVPVFRRTWRKFTNIAVTISAMSVLLSVTGGFNTALTFGGPAIMIWGWIGVSLCCICIALGMAELSSSYPTSGGMYFWMYQLLGPRSGPFVCWVTGWVNMLGQIASLASTNYFVANTLQTFVLLATGTARPADSYAPPAPAVDGAEAVVAEGEAEESVGPGFTFNAKQTLGIYAGLLILSGLFNTFGGRSLVYVTEFAAVWHLIGILILVVGVPLIAKEHQSAEYVFTKFETELATDTYQVPSKFYVGILGLLLPAYAYTGYDGPAHMAEESQDAVIANPQGIMAGMYFMAITGFAWIISLLFSMSDRTYVLGEGDITPEADGDAVAQILWDAFEQRTGNGKQSLYVLFIIILGVFFCSISTLTYISRILFAYSRDRAVPLSWLWVKRARNGTPVWAVWGACLAAFIIAIPSVRNELAFSAILSLSTIALNIAYVAPSFVRITWGRSRFVPGPWNLGKWAYPVNTIATLWVAFAVIIFSLPTEYPVDANVNLNYAGVTLLATVFLSVAWYWFPFIGAYKWFKGPVHETDEASTTDVDIQIAAVKNKVMDDRTAQGPIVR